MKEAGVLFDIISATALHGASLIIAQAYSLLSLIALFTVLYGLM